MIRKFILGTLFFVVVVGVVFLIGRNSGIKSITATIDLYNGSNFSIMTAVVEHETGSSIVASIKRNRTQKIRLLVQGPTAYSLKVTFENNKTIYSRKNRYIKNGDKIKEIVSDSTITLE
jgi:hypothetical protein